MKWHLVEDCAMTFSKGKELLCVGREIERC